MAEPSMQSFELRCRAVVAGVLAAFSLCAGQARAAPLDLSITPIPAVVVAGTGSLRLADGAGVETAAGDLAALSAARWLAATVARDRGLTLNVGRGAPKIRFVRSSSASHPSDAADLGEEGYRLDVSDQGVRIEAAGDAGLFYGAVSLAQLLTPEDGSRGGVTLTGAHIEDRPRFAWRGLMLDSARHIQSVAFIEALLDQMARYKLNMFHWHLTDDQGWRLQIKAYPRLTEIGAWRVEAGEAHLRDIDPATGRPRLYGGFYTQAQVRAVVAYARARCITVAPEIEMPGHATAPILAYPELGVRPADPKTTADWGVFPNLYRPDDKTFAVLQTVLTEVMDLFPGPYIHIGGDEAIKDYWKASPEIQAQIKALGLKDEDALQSWFIQRIERFVAAHGRRMVGWDEILQGGLPSGAVVMSWQGVSGAVQAARAGHDAVLTPGLPFYLDNRQSAAANEPPGRGLIITLKNVYGFDPTPRSLDAASRAHILGLQANVWTEHIRLDRRVEEMAFPRAIAMAEMAWSPPARRNWESFVARLPAALRRDEALGLTPSRSAFAVQAALAESGDHNVDVRLSTEAGLGAVRYTLDGSSPDASSPLYGQPLHLKWPTTLRAQAFLGGVGLAPAMVRRLDSQTLLRRDSHALGLCSDKLTLNVEADRPVDSDHRAVVLVDLLNPCWMWKGADLSGIKAISAEVGQLPFNYQLGDDPRTVPLTPSLAQSGALEVRLGGCDGPVATTLALSPGPGDRALTTVSGPLSGTGPQDLCFILKRRTLDPMWVLNAVQLVPAGPQPVSQDAARTNRFVDGAGPAP